LHGSVGSIDIAGFVHGLEDTCEALGIGGGSGHDGLVPRPPAHPARLGHGIAHRHFWQIASAGIALPLGTPRGKWALEFVGPAGAQLLADLETTAPWRMP